MKRPSLLCLPDPCVLASRQSPDTLVSLGKAVRPNPRTGLRHEPIRASGDATRCAPHVKASGHPSEGLLCEPPPELQPAAAERHAPSQRRGRVNASELERVEAEPRGAKLCSRWMIDLPRNGMVVDDRGSRYVTGSPPLERINGMRTTGAPGKPA